MYIQAASLFKENAWGPGPSGKHFCPQCLEQIPFFPTACSESCLAHPSYVGRGFGTKDLGCVLRGSHPPCEDLNLVFCFNPEEFGTSVPWGQLHTYCASFGFLPSLWHLGSTLPNPAHTSFCLRISLAIKSCSIFSTAKDLRPFKSDVLPDIEALPIKWDKACVLWLFLLMSGDWQAELLVF